jgi:plasmid stabilization system protein ParE
MPTRVVLTRTVQTTLLDILDHIAADSPQAALAFIDALEARLVTTLRTFPEAGPVYGGDLRFQMIRGYAFIYRYDAKRETVFVLDACGPEENWRPV